MSQQDSDSQVVELRPVPGDLCAVTPQPAPGAAEPPGLVQARPEVPGEDESRLAFTPAALALIDKLWAMHGPLMFHQSGGCCDGSAPMCYQAGEFRTGESDILLGTLQLPPLDSSAGTAAPDAAREIGFWMSREQFAVWAHTHITVDAVPGRGSGFSLDAPEGQRFLIRSRLLGQKASLG